LKDGLILSQFSMKSYDVWFADCQVCYLYRKP